MELIGHIIELIKSFWENLLPIHIVSEYEHGVLLRIGKFNRRVDAGMIWKIPFFDTVLVCHNTITTLNLKSQSLTTLDGNDVVISGIVKYKITNPKKFLLEVEDAIDAINDITQGKIKQLVVGMTWEELRELKDEQIRALVDPEINNWGIKVYYITITDLAKIRSIRLINS